MIYVHSGLPYTWNCAPLLCHIHIQVVDNALPNETRANLLGRSPNLIEFCRHLISLYIIPVPIIKTSLRLPMSSSLPRRICNVCGHVWGTVKWFLGLNNVKVPLYFTKSEINSKNSCRYMKQYHGRKHPEVASEHMARHDSVLAKKERREVACRFSNTILGKHNKT
jgi:hypothetical protein